MDGNGNPKYGREAIGFFSLKKSITDKILTIELEGLFRTMNKVGCSLGSKLWARPLETSHYARLKAPLIIFYWLFSTHFFGLSTKCGLSIETAISVKRPSYAITLEYSRIQGH
jgi:hypothetical protein